MLISRVLKHGGYLFGGLAIVTSTALAIWCAISVFLNPAPYTRTPLDNRMAIFYAIILSLIGLTFWVARGRLLLAMSLLVGVGLILITLFASGAGVAFLILLWLLFASIAAGDWVFDRLNVLDNLSLAERLGLDIALGFGEFMVVSLLMGLTRLYYAYVAVSLLMLVTIIFLPHFWRHLWPEVKSKLSVAYSDLQNKDFRWQALTAAILLVLVVGAYLWALAPTIRYDALTYHVSAPAIYLQNHALVRISESMSTTWVHYAEMLYTFGMLLHGQPLPGMLHLTVGLLSALLTFTLGRRIINARVGILSAILFLSTPLVSYEMGTAYIDFFISFYTLAMIVCGIISLSENHLRWFLISGIFGGIALGIKLSAAPVVISYFLIFLLIGIFRSKSFQPVFIAFSFGLIVLLIALPWFIRDWLFTGDPIWPFGRVLLPQLIPASASSSNSVNSSVLNPNWLFRMLLFPWNLVVHSSSYYHESPGAILGALPLLGLPWLYLSYSGFSTKTRRYLALLLILVLLSAILIFTISYGLARYLSSLYPLVAILAASNLEVLWRYLGTTKAPKPFYAIGLAMALIYVFNTRLALTVRTMGTPVRYPARLFLGQESKAEFLSRTLPVYPVFQYLDRQETGSHKVLSIGNEFRLYTKSTINGVGDSPGVYQMIANSKNADELASRMAENGYDYLLIDKPSKAYLPQKYEFAILNSDFLDRYTRLEEVNQGIYLYRFYPEGANNEFSPNLLQNNSFEYLNVEGYPERWEWNGKIQVDRTDHARTGLTSVQLHGPVFPIEYGYIFQDVPVEGGQMYTNGYWVYSKTPVTLQLQVYWLDKAGQFISSNMEWETSQPGWKWHQMSALSPENAQIGRFFASINGQEVAWFDDLCFVKGQRCP